MTRRRRILLLATTLIAVVGTVVTIVGPWPTYKSGFEDKPYYDKDEKGGYGYERGTMSWIGPDQEAFTVSLITRMIDVLFGESSQIRQGFACP
jgi:hypothetical protein